MTRIFLIFFVVPKGDNYGGYFKDQRRVISGIIESFYETKIINENNNRNILSGRHIKDFSNIFMEHQRVQKSRFYLKFLRDPKEEKSGKFFRHFDEPLKGTNFEGFF